MKEELLEVNQELEECDTELRGLSEKLKEFANQQEPIQVSVCKKTCLHGNSWKPPRSCIEKIFCDMLQDALSAIGDKIHQAKDRKKHFDNRLRGHMDRVQELKVVEEKKKKKYEVGL